MMTAFSWAMLASALGIGVTHTLLGPDHYLPFVMLARARRWSFGRTLAITAVCGVGHVAGSIALGAVGLAIGVAVGGIEGLEGMRGDWAAWALVAFGAAYALWGIRQALRRKHGIAAHAHEQHVHLHTHGDHPHRHAEAAHGSDRAATFWALFIAFVLGPCEPLIPLFVLPASRGEFGVAAVTAAVFGSVTVLTMLATTALGLLGMNHLPLGSLERWAHAMAGTVIAACGLSVLVLGL